MGEIPWGYGTKFKRDIKGTWRGSPGGHERSGRVMRQPVVPAARYLPQRFRCCIDTTPTILVTTTARIVLQPNLPALQLEPTLYAASFPVHLISRAAFQCS